MGLRVDLQAILEEIPNVAEVYFQPPASKALSFPAIVYERDGDDVDFANNKPYDRTKRYQITVIDRNPDSLIPDEVGKLPMSTFNRHFTVDNLHHDVYSVYF